MLGKVVFMLVLHGERGSVEHVDVCGELPVMFCIKPV
jgi:hypothetical protein